MNKSQILTYIGCTIGVLAEMGTGSPESMLYLGLGCTLSDWNDLRGLMVSSELVTVNHNYMELTAKGNALGAKINAAHNQAHA